MTLAQVLVDEAYWSFTMEPDDNTLGRLQRGVITIPYPWVEGETHAVRLISRNGVTFDAEIPVAMASPVPSVKTFGFFVLLGLIVSPVSADYHYVIALLPIGILLSQFRGQLRSWPGLILITGTLLIAADLPYRTARLTPGAWAFFAYPKLYGALLLWGLALRGSKSAASATAAEPTRSPVP